MTAAPAFACFLSLICIVASYGGAEAGIVKPGDQRRIAGKHEHSSAAAIERSKQGGISDRRSDPYHRARRPVSGAERDRFGNSVDQGRSRSLSHCGESDILLSPSGSEETRSNWRGYRRGRQDIQVHF